MDEALKEQIVSALEKAAQKVGARLTTKEW